MGNRFNSFLLVHLLNTYLYHDKQKGGGRQAEIFPGTTQYESSTIVLSYVTTCVLS